MNFKRKLKQTGVTLIEMVLVLGIIMAITVSELEQKVRETEQASAKSLGNELFMFSNGVRAYIAENYEQLLTTDIPGGATPGSFDIIPSLLKDATCPGGLGTVKYVPCNLNDNTKFGAFPLTATATLAGTQITATADIGPINIQGDIRQDLASIAALTAAGMSLNGGNPTQASTTASFLTDARGVGPGPYVPPLLAPAGSIRMIIDQNGAQDAWLRVDGTNDMEADISFDGANTAASRGIVNIARLSNLNPGGGAADDFINFESAINMAGATPALRLIDNLDTLQNDGVIGNATRLTVNDDATVVGELDVNVNIETPLMIDMDDTRYEVDPAAVSSLRTLNTNLLRSDTNVSTRMNIASDEIRFTDRALTSNSLFTGTVDVQQFNVQFYDNWNASPAARRTEVLGDLLPRYVNRGVFHVNDSQFVAKPSCINGAQAKIVIVPTSVGMVSYLPYTQIRYASNSNGGIQTVYGAFCNGAGNCVAKGHYYARAVDFGASWQVQIASSIPDPDGAMPTMSGLAMVYCQAY